MHESAPEPSVRFPQTVPRRGQGFRWGVSDGPGSPRRRRSAGAAGAAGGDGTNGRNRAVVGGGGGGVGRGGWGSCDNAGVWCGRGGRDSWGGVDGGSRLLGLRSVRSGWARTRRRDQGMFVRGVRRSSGDGVRHVVHRTGRGCDEEDNLGKRQVKGSHGGRGIFGPTRVRGKGVSSFTVEQLKLP